MSVPGTLLHLTTQETQRIYSETQIHTFHTRELWKLAQVPLPPMEPGLGFEDIYSDLEVYQPAELP